MPCIFRPGQRASECSITHTENFIGAVVESAENLRGIGIDTEKILGPQSVVMVESLVEF